MKCRISSFAVVLILAAGCSTVKPPYKPTKVGPVHAARPLSGIALSLSTSRSHAAVGEPLRFSVKARNVGVEPVWFPRDPRIILTWVYPSGRRDNFCDNPPPAAFHTERTAVLLEPGDEVTETILVKTYYFPQPGITEFRAVLKVPGSTNSELRPFWAGRAVSNAFGILMVGEETPMARAHLPVEQRAGRAS